MDQLCCTKSGHGNKPIQGICISPICQSDQRIWCLTCLQTMHSICENKFLEKDTFINLLTELQLESQQRAEPKIMQTVRELTHNSRQFLMQLSSFAGDLLEKYEKINPFNRIDQILKKKDILSSMDWNEGYKLLTETEQIVPESPKVLIEQLYSMKKSIDSIAQIYSAQVDDQNTCRENKITPQKAFIINTSHQISAIALSPNGNCIASSGFFGDFQIQIWDMITGNPFGNLKGHSSNIGSISYSKCGQLLVSCSGDKTIRQWDVSKYRQLGEPMTGHQEPVTGVQYSSDQKYIISGSLDQTIRIWDSKTGKECKRIQHGQLVLCLSLSPIKNEVAIGSDDISIWNYDKQQLSGRSLESQCKCLCIRYSPNGKQILSGTQNYAILLWDADSRTLIKSFIGHTSEVYSVNFSPNSKYLISGGKDQSVRLWDLQIGKQIGQTLLHKAVVPSAQFSLCGKYIITGGWDKQIRILITPIDQ